jgi:hypothetical protein
LPPAYVVGPDGRPWHSWRVLLLPYIEQDNLYRQYDFSEPWDGPNNRRLAERMPRMYAYAGEDQPGNMTTNYLAVVGPETAWPGSATISYDDVSDGTGTTILLVENRGMGVHWMEPRDLVLADMDLALNSPHGVSSKYDPPAVGMLNGGIYSLGPAVTPEILRAMLTIRGGEPVKREGGSWQWLPDGRQRPLRQP